MEGWSFSGVLPKKRASLGNELPAGVSFPDLQVVCGGLRENTQLYKEVGATRRHSTRDSSEENMTAGVPGTPPRLSCLCLPLA